VAAAAVLRKSLGRIASLRLDIEVDRLVVTALKAASPGPTEMLFNAGCEAGLDRDRALARASIAFMNFATFNLADDLSDGDCHYLPRDQAPAILLILNNVVFAGLRDLELPRPVEAEILADLISAEHAQVLEIATTTWSARRLWSVTDGIAGRQWSAYLRLVWAGTRLEGLADEIAHQLGRVVLLAGDIESGDARYASLPSDDRRAVASEALANLHGLEARSLAFAGQQLAACRTVLVEEFARLSAPSDTTAAAAPWSQASLTTKDR
jgi:hypothetical protein